MAQLAILDPYNSQRKGGHIMSTQISNNSGNHGGSGSRKFCDVTRHLRYQDFKWLKEDMGLFELPEDWDLPFNNDNSVLEH